MANFVFDAAKAKGAMWAADVNTGTATMEVILLEAAGIESDATLAKKLLVSTLLAGTTNEETSFGRKIIGPGAGSMSIVDSTIDDTTYVGFGTTHRVQSWSITGGNPIAAAVVAYRRSGAGSGDANLFPMVKLDASYTPGVFLNHLDIDFGSILLEAV